MVSQDYLFTNLKYNIISIDYWSIFNYSLLQDDKFKIPKQQTILKYTIGIVLIFLATVKKNCNVMIK